MDIAKDGHYQVLSVFHHASMNADEGALVVAKDGGNLIFWWRQYPKLKNGKLLNNSAKNEVIIHSKDIQKFVVNYRENDPHILFVVLNSIHQFIFPASSLPSLISFIQLLTIQKCQSREEPPSLEAIIDFATETFALNESKYTSYNMDCESGHVTIPQDYCTNGLLPKKLFVVQPELNIISKFKIVKEEYTQHPLTMEDFIPITSITELKKKVLKYGITPELRYYIWPVILEILPIDPAARDEILKIRVEEYKSIKEQWLTLSKHQIKSFPAIREAFGTIRVDVKRTHPPPGVTVTEEWSETIVALLKSFTIWNQNLHYTQGLNDICATIMILFAQPTCTALEPDVAEALSFWCFAHFVEKGGRGLVSENMLEMQTTELKEIYDIVERYSANANWLRSQHMDDLSFLISPLMLAYGRSFDKSTVARLWETVSCVDNPWVFLRYFSASLIIFALQTFMLIPDCSSAKLVSLLDDIFPKFDIGAIIAVALNMMEESKEPAEPPRKDSILEEGSHSDNYRIYQEYNLFR